MRSVAALLIFASPLVARAEPPSLTPPVDPPTIEDHTSYARYTLTADGLSIGAYLAGMASEGAHGEDRSSTGTLYAIGLLGGFFATPIIHGIRGHGGRAVGSFLLRSGAASVGMAVGVAMQHCASEQSLCELDGIGPV